MQKARWTCRNLLTWLQVKEKDKLWTINHSSEIILQMIDLTWSSIYRSSNLFAQFCLAGVQKSAGLFYACTTFRIFTCSCIGYTFNHTRNGSDIIDLTAFKSYNKLNPVISRRIVQKNLTKWLKLFTMCCNFLKKAHDQKGRKVLGEWNMLHIFYLSSMLLCSVV